MTDPSQPDTLHKGSSPPLRLPWSAYAFLCGKAAVCCGFLNLAFERAAGSDSSILSLLSGLLILLSVPLGAYALLDYLLLSRGQQAASTPQLNYFSNAAVGLSLLVAVASLIASASVQEPRPVVPIITNTPAELPRQKAATHSRGEPTIPSRPSFPGADLPIPGKPYSIWCPQGWSQGDSAPYLCDIVIVDPLEEIVVTITLLPKIDLPPAQRSSKAIISHWRDNVTTLTTQPEWLTPLSCSLLGQATQLHRVDTTDAAKEGETRLRVSIAAVDDGNYLCRVAIIIRPSLAEQMGEEVIRSVVEWPQGTASTAHAMASAAAKPPNRHAASESNPIDGTRDLPPPAVSPVSITPDQEYLNNLVLSAHLLSQVPEQASFHREFTRKIGTAGVAQDIVDAGGRHQARLREIGALEDRIIARLKKGDSEASEAGLAGGLQGGLEAAATLTQLDASSGGEIGADPLAMLVAGAVGGAIRSTQMATAAGEAAQRDVQAIREEQRDIATQALNDLLNVRDRLRIDQRLTAFDLKPEDLDVAGSLEVTPAQLPALLESFKKRACAWNCIVCAMASQSCDPDTQIALAECAISEWPSCIDAHSQEHAALWNILGQGHLQKDMLEQAMEDFGKAISFHGNIPLFYSNRALARMALMDHEGAVADARQAQRLDPSAMPYWYVEGMAHAIAGDSSSTVRCLKEASIRGWCDVADTRASKWFAKVVDSREMKEFLECKWKWWSKDGLLAGDVFLRNDSDYALTNVSLTPEQAGPQSTLRASRIAPGETFRWEWVDSKAVNTKNAKMSCDQIK
jgi:tetratricopeptide (TPR) repeat protein